MAKANFVCVAVPGMTDNKTAVYSAGGKLLADEGRPDGVMAAGLKAWSALPEADRKPKKITPLAEFADPPAPPPNGLILKEYSRALLRDEKGKLLRPTRVLMSGGAYGWNAEPQLDFVWLTEAEWKSLLPADAVKGATHPVPAAIVHKIGTFHLLDKSLGTPDFYWDKVAGAMTVTADEVTAAAHKFSLAGEMKLGDQQYPVKFRGKFVFDPKKKAITKFDLTALGRDDGDQRSPEGRVARNKSAYEVPKGCVPLLAVSYERVEGTAVIDRVPPYAIMYDAAKNYGKPYFPKE